MAKYKILTLEQKEEVIRFAEKHNIMQAAKHYHLPYGTVHLWSMRVRKAKKTDKHPLARRYLINEEKRAFIQALHAKYPNATLAQIKEMAAPKFSISRTKIWHLLTGR